METNEPLVRMTKEMYMDLAREIREIGEKRRYHPYDFVSVLEATAFALRHMTDEFYQKLETDEDKARMFGDQGEAN
jgi:cupin superfamily acireductone dioxygenase involved in methionine salvage